MNIYLLLSAMKNLIFITLLLATVNLTAENKAVELNFLDENNDKQGLWEVKSTANLSKGNYKNNVRVGLWQHFKAENELNFSSYYLEGIDTIKGTKNTMAMASYVQELQQEVLKIKTELKQVKEAMPVAIENSETLHEELKGLKQTKSILLIIIGIFLIAFALFYPKLIKKM
jgi:hypothetical protein